MLKSITLQGKAIQCLLALVLAAATLASQGAHAQQTMPEGMTGWWYYTHIGPGEQQYAADPVTACSNSARNHMGTPLLAMRPNASGAPFYDCKYSHFMRAGGQDWYASTILVCNIGYRPRSPGVCVKDEEIPAPLSCRGSDPGASLGNPVQLASGAKVQAETDLIGGPDLLRIGRTYRTLRQNSRAQSGGPGWSFSFDREFTVVGAGSGAPSVSGTLGDGSYFQFVMQPNGSFRSFYEQRLTLQSLSDKFDDWLLTTSEGQVERYSKVGEVFRLMSSHTSDGVALNYTYNAGNQLTQISDQGGRSISIGWHLNRVISVDGPDGGARYEYDEAFVAANLPPVEGMGSLVAVQYHDRAGVLLASRHYHYGHGWQRDFLTGITDENGVRFATYAYNDAGQAVLSEHADGAMRYAFAYPAKATRIVTDPLGTQRTFSIGYGGDSRGRITGESQPAGAGCSAGASAMTYDSGGALASRTDFNDRKTCFANDPNRGLEVRRISGLTGSISCPAGADNLPTKTARMVSTQWHPDWPLASAIAEANRIVTHAYNG